MLWAEEENAAGADIAGDQSDWKFFLNVVDAAKPQRQPQGRAGIFAVFGVDADGVRGHADELAGLGLAEERHDAERRQSRAGSRGRA